jgi:hypothetical protein
MERAEISEDRALQFFNLGEEARHENGLYDHFRQFLIPNP